MNDNIKKEWRVILNETLNEVEMARLLTAAKTCGMMDVEFNKCVISFRSDHLGREVFKMTAAWLSYIGADQDIFCIQEITSYYTGMTSPEVKDLMRTT